MMRRDRDRRRAVLVLVLAVLVAGSCVAPLSAVAAGAAVSSTALVEEPLKYDGHEVTFVGEAIGELMVRGDAAWLHLNDDAYMMKNVEEGAALGGYNSGMPVWLQADLGRTVTTFGDYEHEGDVVEVEGVFNAACAQHGGDMDIHASGLIVRVPGHQAADPVKAWKLPVIALLGIVVMAVWFAERRLGQRERIGILRDR